MQVNFQITHILLAISHKIKSLTSDVGGGGVGRHKKPSIVYTIPQALISYLLIWLYVTWSSYTNENLLKYLNPPKKCQKTIRNRERILVCETQYIFSQLHSNIWVLFLYLTLLAPVCTVIEYDNMKMLVILIRRST